MSNTKFKIYVDGQVGTTGLQIAQRLKNRDELEILSINEEMRKSVDERKRLMNLSDIVFLCLPDEAAVEAVKLIENPETRVIDASNAHRINENFVYGFAELELSQREKIRKARFISNPGCHATGFSALIHPLRNLNILDENALLSCYSLTGYSGGGKSMIEKYEQKRVDNEEIKSPQLYSLGLKHKHLPEMTYHNQLVNSPLFTPIVADFKQGMLVNIPLRLQMLKGVTKAEDLQKVYSDYYAGEKFIRVMPFGADAIPPSGFLTATNCNNTNSLEIFVFNNGDQILLVARFDNLGKGASGAAVQNMNIMLRLEEGLGVDL